MALTLQRGNLLEKYGPYVRSLANGVRKQFCLRVDLEDLISYGNIGLFEAAERFDPKVNANFLGAFRGPEQRPLYISERASNYLASAASRDYSGPRNMSDDVREVENAVTSLAAIFAATMDGSDHLQIRDESISPEERVELTELKQRVRVAIEKLPDNERKLLIVYYYEGKTLEEAGTAISQSKSWASRLHARAIERLKTFLAEEIEAHGAKPAETSLLVDEDDHGAGDKPSSKRSQSGGTR